ncbi:MAG: patatin-like phospholipase family protein [Spirochaetia bacterium]|nr:patatin-like phospholipase family protein [Spirochaetia bacterium]
MKRKNRISLNLGGGAARGFAHIGVIRALNEEKIPYDMIIGVSMGAVVGSIYCENPDIENLEKVGLKIVEAEKFKESILGSWHKDSSQSARNILKILNSLYKKTGIIGKILLSTGILNDEDIEELLGCFIPDISFEKMKFPFACVGVCLEEGETRIFNKGSVKDAVLASASLPLVFPPKEIDGLNYIDGGVIDKVAIDASEELNIDFTIVSDVSNENIKKPIIRNGLDIMFFIEETASKYRKKRQLEKATVIIKPVHKDIHWSDYSSSKELIESGYETTRKQIEEIRHKLNLKNPFKKWFFLERRKLKS